MFARSSILCLPTLGNILEGTIPRQLNLPNPSIYTIHQCATSLFGSSHPYPELLTFSPPPPPSPQISNNSFTSQNPPKTQLMDKFSFQSATDECYRCGFLVHVHSATLLIGTIGSLAGAAVLACLLQIGADSDQCLITGLMLGSYAFLVLGWTIRLPCLYWPFLLLNPLCMCLCAVFCCWPSLLFLLSPLLLTPSPSAYSDHPADHDPHHQLLLQLTRHLRAIEFFCSVGLLLLLFYFQSIVFRAHNWLRKKNQIDNQICIIGDPQTPV